MMLDLNKKIVSRFLEVSDSYHLSKFSYFIVMVLSEFVHEIKLFSLKLFMRKFNHFANVIVFFVDFCVCPTIIVHYSANAS